MVYIIDWKYRNYHALLGNTWQDFRPVYNHPKILEQYELILKF